MLLNIVMPHPVYKNRYAYKWRGSRDTLIWSVTQYTFPFSWKAPGHIPASCSGDTIIYTFSTGGISFLPIFPFAQFPLSVPLLFVCLFSIKKNNLWPTDWRPLDTFSMDTFVWLVWIENKDFFLIPFSWDFSVMSERDTAWVFSKYFQFINNSNE